MSVNAAGSSSSMVHGGFMFPSSDEGSSCLALGQHKDVTCKGYIYLPRQQPPPTPGAGAGSATMTRKQQPPTPSSHPSSVEPSSGSCEFPMLGPTPPPAVI